VQKTSTGLFIPEKSQEKLSEGTVLAVGAGGIDKDGKRIPMDVKVGDKVLECFDLFGREVWLTGGFIGPLTELRRECAQGW